MVTKKYLDYDGVKYLWAKINTKTDSLIYEHAVIELTTNQGAGVSTTVTVTIDGSSTNYSYNNSPITIKIKGGSTYTVSFGSLTDYKTPSSVSYTASAGTSRNISAEYKASIITINITGASSGSATVSGYKSGTAINGSTYQVPFGSSLTITPKQVKPYTTPSAQTITASANTHTVTLDYKSVVLTMKFSGLSSTSLGSVTVSASGMNTATVSHNNTVRVPYNTTITITPKTIEGYNSPPSINKKYTSNTTVTLTWEEVKRGVFILDNSGNLKTPSTWTGGSNCQGVALLTDNVSICISKRDEVMEWGGFGVELTGCSRYESSQEAITDFAGSDNTDVIRSELSGRTDSQGIYGAPAADYCKSFGSSWYLPAYGELYEIIRNYEEINEALSIISASTFIEGETYWTSTQFSYGVGMEEYNWNEAWSIDAEPNPRSSGQEKHIGIRTRAIKQI